MEFSINKNYVYRSIDINLETISESLSNSKNVIFDQYLLKIESLKPMKRKRRRKDSNLQTYICTCGKQYFSNSALNKHIKIKHSSKYVMQNPNFKSREKRGRPKMTVI